MNRRVRNGDIDHIMYNTASFSEMPKFRQILKI